MKQMVLKNANLLDVANEKCLEGYSVLVENGRIKEIAKEVNANEDALVLDLTGKTVAPGFFNCHTHFTSEANPSGAGASSDAISAVVSIENMQKYLKSGITYIRDVGGANGVDIDIRNMVKAGRVVGPDMQVSGRNICMTGGHGWSMGHECDSPDECRKAARTELKKGADWIKLMASGGVMTKGNECGCHQLTEEEMRAAVVEAHKAGAKTCTHAQGMESIKAALRAGLDSIEHGFWMDDWCFDYMKEHNVFYVPTLAAVYWIVVKGEAAGIPDFMVRKASGAMEAHIDTCKRAYDAGVKMALGTDAGTPFNEHDLTLKELELLVNAGIRPWDAIKFGTINAAELLDVSDDLGEIAVGKKATFAVFEKDIVADVTAAMDCYMTIKDGVVVYQKEA